MMDAPIGQDALVLELGVVLQQMLDAGVGVGDVVDGDTIKLDGITYRIWGIDAGESKQACADGWPPAGQEATAAMLELVKGRAITCEAKATDRYGHTVALCRADGTTLAQRWSGSCPNAWCS